MSHLRFKRYLDKYGNLRFDPENGEIGGFWENHIKDLESQGHTIEFVKDTPRMANEATTPDIDALIEAQIIKNASGDNAQALIDQSMGDIGPNADPTFSREVMNERQRLNKALVEAGVKLPAVGGLHDPRTTLGVLKNNVPGAFERHLPKRNIYERIHMTTELNPITKQQEVVPFMDPNNPDRILRTVMGRVNNLPGGHELGAEYVGEQALKLMGKQTKIGNTDIRKDSQGFPIMDRRGNPKLKTNRSDLVDVDTGDRVDVEVRDTTNFEGKKKQVFPQQIYTQLTPLGGLTPKDPKEMREMVENMIYAQLRDPEQNLSIEEAVEKLISEGQLGPNIGDKYRIGKAIKSDPSRVSEPEDMMHKIIMPGYNYDLAKTLERSDNRRNRIGLPETLHMIDLPATRAYLNQLKGKVNIPSNHRGLQPGMNTRDSTGATFAGDLRARLYSNVPITAKYQGQSLATDVTKTNPMTQQLLAKQPYVLQPQHRLN